MGIMPIAEVTSDGVCTFYLRRTYREKLGDRNV